MNNPDQNTPGEKQPGAGRAGQLSAIFAAVAKQHGATGVTPLAGGGLTHDHYILNGTGRLLRVPRRNQLGMSPEDYLAQQEGVYRAAEPSGATPKYFATIPPQPGLPNGALVIEYIESQKPEDADRKAMAAAIGALNTTHAASVPMADQPFGSQWFVINDIFGEALKSDKLDPLARQLLAAEKAALKAEMDKLAGDTSIPMALIGADSHVGNFIVDKTGKAWFVDLEFLTSDVPHIDAADAASPLTSQLDATNRIKFNAAEKAQFYKDWGAATGYDASPAFDRLITLSERMVNLRTLAWLAYWLDEGHAQQNAPQASRDNWDRMAKEYLDPDYLQQLLAPKTAAAKPAPKGGAKGMSGP